MRVSVNLRDDVARGVVEPTQAGEAARGVLEAVGQVGARLAPTHAGHTDPTLRGWFGIEVADERTALDLCDALLAIDGVDAAYIEPPVSPA